jgi:hypothetical protein
LDLLSGSCWVLLYCAWLVAGLDCSHGFGARSYSSVRSCVRLSLSWLEAWWPGGFSVFFFLQRLLVLARVGVRGPVSYAPSAFIGSAAQ